MTPKWYLPRRTILRGLGSSVALPFLEAMVRPEGTSRAARAAEILDPQRNPRRFVGIWGLPCGLVGKWDPVQNAWVSPWTPDQEGPLTKPDAPGFLQPFWDPQYQGANKSDPLYNKLSVLTGVTNITSGHQFLAALLTPGRFYCNECTADCREDINVHGMSADQAAAQYLGKFTEIPMLTLGTHPPLSSNYPYEIYLSWKSATVPQSKDIDPPVVFDRLFKDTFDPKEDPAITARRKLYRKSVMDTVLGHAKTIQAKVGRQDQMKLGQYFEGIQDLEKRIDQLSKPLTCSKPGRPDEFADGANQSYTRALDVRLKLMMDLMVKAFECDRTRVATLTYTNSYGTTPTWLGLSGPHHDMSHYDDDRPSTAGTPAQRIDYMNKWGKWVVKMYAYLASELDKVTEIGSNGQEATLLDNSAIMMSGDTCDSSLHSWNSTNMLLLGRGGRSADGNWAIKAGRHHRVTPPWPNGACGYNTPDHSKTYCRDPKGAYYEYWTMPDRTFAEERSTKDLLWGMLNAIGIPEATGKSWAAPGIGASPVDLTFPGKA